MPNSDHGDMVMRIIIPATTVYNEKTWVRPQERGH